jgi:hypothetical protein
MAAGWVSDSSGAERTICVVCKPDSERTTTPVAIPENLFALGLFELHHLL